MFQNLFRRVLGGNDATTETDINSEISYLDFADNPEKAWSVAKSSQVFNDVELPINEPKKEGHVRVVCISDTHNRTPGEVPAGDILIHAGDFTRRGKIDQVEEFNKFLGSLNHPHKVVIAGNHDIGFHQQSAQRLHGRNFVPEEEVKAALTDCTYLEDAEVEILGLRIYGSPWTPVFGDWAFTKHRGEAMNEMWEKIPNNIDILVTHGPPLGYGLSSDGTTTFINASTCNLMYRAINKPVVFDIEVNEKNVKK